MIINSTLLKLEESHVEKAGEVLARAFMNDPLFSYFIPDTEERKQVLPFIFQSMVRYGILYGEAYSVSLNFEGVAVWLPSEQAEMTMWRMFRSKGFSLIYKKLSRQSRNKMMDYYKESSKLHQKNANFPHWYLLFIGIESNFQGKGYATKLLKPMLKRFEKEKLPVYLETQNDSNVPFYEHFGFKVLKKIKIANTDFNHCAMIKSPYLGS